MENRDLALIFDEMANILEIQNGNPFRIRSFHRSAQIIENLSMNVARALEEGDEKLRKISGIGPGTIEKIREIVETGDCQEYLQLRNQVPPTLLTLLKLRHLGPKKISLFWKTLNITTIDELEAATQSRKLQILPGIGERSESKIFKSIQEYRLSQGRFRLDDGIALSQSLIDYLKDRVKVKRIAAAGSLRRRKETIGDIDILVTCQSPSHIIQVFVQHPDITEIVAQGSTKASIILRRGLRADLRVLDEGCFGSSLQYFTGSKAHNVALQGRAKRRGYKISEYGIFAVDKKGFEKKVAGENEEDIYRLLGLQFISPELRENQGEIEKAELGRLPQLIQDRDIQGDLHMHTTASDGRDSIEAMANVAIEADYRYIAITNHSKSLAMTGGLDDTRLLQHIAEIDAISAQKPGIHILKGIEVDILSGGQLDLGSDILSQLDVVIASIHSRFNLTRKEMTLRICRALENPLVNILAHPTGRLLTRREPYPLDLEQVIRTARENRVCLEINAYPARLDLGDTNCRLARDMGALLSINADSHSCQMLHFLRYGVFTARRGWLEANDVINTYPIDRLKRVLSKEEYR